MTTKIAADRDYELWVLLHQARDTLSAARENETMQFGITIMQAAVLFVVKAIDGPAKPADISRWMLRAPHTVSALLVRMEKQGLVTRTKDLERKNLVRIELTEKGEEALRRSMELKSVHNIFSCLSQEEHDNLRGYLERLRNKALEEPRGTPTKPPFP